jgi:ATP-binding cassette subfamily F protein 3
VEKSAEVQSGKKYMEELSCEKQELGEADTKPVLSAEEQRRLNKQIEAEERRIRRRKEALETQMADLEEEIAELEAKMCAPENSSNYGLLAELGTQIEEAKSKHDEAMEEWMMLEDGM